LKRLIQKQKSKKTKRNKNQKKKKKEIKSCRVIFYFNNKKISVLPTSGH
tara:strand:+ start:521 stop:667 length:147 start_codon:yes stop_codon:yes gene_type:complete